LQHFIDLKIYFNDAKAHSNAKSRRILFKLKINKNKRDTRYEIRESTFQVQQLSECPEAAMSFAQKTERHPEL
jgi:hypothetical protein